jgi:Restriction endonuclease NotI
VPKRSERPPREPPGNFVSEWFGHRVYPLVVSTAEALANQRTEHCPFLSEATGEARRCIKSDASKGVCTINSSSNRMRQDWLVCPYRALDPALIGTAVRRLFGLPAGVVPRMLPALNLQKPEERGDVALRLAAGELIFIYFDMRLGGELSIPSTARSPEFSFDMTVVELLQIDDAPHIGRFGILEIQTMDFHGSYRTAVRNLREGLRMHADRFSETLRENQRWLAEGVEGPNIANVFKRTFYQMMFKFQLGKHDRCAGCVLAIPQAVWDSWQKHLGAPDLTAEEDGTFSLLRPNHRPADGFPAWIFVFDTAPKEDVTPSAIVLNKVIGTDAPSVSYWALEVAPDAALGNISSEMGLLAALARRLMPIWPELARTITL